MAGPQRLRIDLAYDGAPFAGFARQPDQRTVQGSLEEALSRVLGQDVRTTGAGRTDRGVHALAQVVHLDVDLGVDDRQGRARRALEDPADLAARVDRMLADPITVWSARRVSDAFHARFSATERAYRYRLVDAPRLAPLERFDRWHVGEPLAVGRMRAGAAHLLGEHDFASFCRRAKGRTTVRRLDAVTVARRHGVVEIALRGPAFCHQQVRSIVGCLVETGRGRREPAWLGTVLAARDRAAAAQVAPPHGLTLERVSYGRAWPAAPARRSSVAASVRGR